MAPASVNVARLLFLLACLSAGVVISQGTRSGFYEVPLTVGVVGGLVMGVFVIWVDTLIKSYSVRGFSSSAFGLLLGLGCAWLIIQVITPLKPARPTDETDYYGKEKAATISLTINTALYASLGFLGAVLALRSSRDDFAFIIPYVRFRQEGSSAQPVVLDAETIMAGRVAAISHAGFLHGRLVVPKFILDELQVLANSPSPARRQRAEKGLACLEQMRSDKRLQVTIEDARATAPNETLQGRLLQAALLLGARLMTSDENLAKVARLRGVDVLNLDELMDALRPKVVVGEKIRLALVRPGKEEHQAVGYLPDGAMLVVNHASNKMNTTQDVVVISTLQTSAGTMVFGELAEAS